MKLRITHLSEYKYGAPVHGNSNELRLTPVQSRWQQLTFFLLRILPSTRVKRYTDFYGNVVNYFEVEEPHRHLLIESTSAVTTFDRYGEGEPAMVALDMLRGADQEERLQPFLQPGGPVEVPPEIWRAAVDVRAEHSDVFGLAMGLMEYVYSSCRYVPGATDVATTSTQFFRTRAGVCQDFSHLMLALCRSVGIPARYVSGYVYDAKRKDIRGAHASHAWVEVWVPGAGWHGLDPTNNCLTRAHYVVVAMGRDYEDIAPVRGSFWGASEREMRVSVHIEERGGG
jgi:transglutaminase-like putative cysteine protease